MRVAVCLGIMALLSGCSVVPSQAWTFDPTRSPPKPSLTASEAAPLRDRVAALQLERNRIRSEIAAEPDAWKRQQHYARLHDVGVELSASERELAAHASQ